MYIFSPIVLSGLQLLGQIPVAVNHLPLRGDVARYSATRTLYSVLVVIFECLIFIFWFWKSTELPTISTQTTFKITSFCSQFATLLAALVPVVVGAFSAKQKILLVEKMREVDFLLQRKLGPPKSRRISLVILYFVFLLDALKIIIVLSSDNRMDNIPLITLFTFAFFQLVVLFSLLEFMELVLSVRERFLLVNERVVEVVMRSRSKQLMWTVALPCVETFAMPQETKMTIPGLSEVHWSLCCVVYDINVIYGEQCVTAMIFIFTHLVYTPYMLFVLYDNMIQNVMYVIFSTLWTLLVTSFLFMLVTPCSMTVKEAKKTVTIVAKLMGHRMAKPLFDELETFADQLFHRDVEFTACGLFTLQTSLVISVASTVTTYMAIIIQFQASAEDGNPTTETVTAATLPYSDNTSGSTG